MTDKTEAQRLAHNLATWADQSHPSWHGAPMVRNAAALLLKQEAAIKVLRTCVKDAAPLQDDKRLRALFDAALTVTEGL